MIKGKTLIELTDVNTGMVEQYEDENIITEAAQLYYDGVLSLFTLSELKSTSYKRMPIWNSVFGGIKLFENTIEESVSNIQMPSVAVNKVVGFASCDASDGTNARRGSRNLQETVALENGVQLVWDFATSEANGTISCVCLTSGYGGENSYFNMINFGSNATTKYPSTRFYEFNHSNDSAAWFFDEYENRLVLKILDYNSGYFLRKYKVSVEDLGFDETFGTPKQIGEPIKIDYGLYFRGKPHPDYYYFINVTSKTLTINKYDKATAEKTTETLTLPMAINSSNDDFGTIFDGFIYLKKDASTVCKVDMNNPSNITELAFEGGALGDYLYKLPNGDFTSGNVVFDPVTGTYYITQSREGIFDGYKIGKSFISKLFEDSYNKGSMYFILGLNDAMLHSINNLETPVTKTADKTMKITYTLTYN